MKVVIGKWQIRASVRIRVPVMQAAQPTLDQPVDIPEAGQVVIESTKPVAYDLETLLAQIIPKNTHRPSDFGKPAGKELW